MEKVTRKYKTGSRNGSYSAFVALMISSPQAKDHLPGIDSFSFDLKPETPPFDSGGDQNIKHCGAVYRSVREDLERMNFVSDYFDAVTSRVWFKNEETLQNMKVCRKEAGLLV